jgi:hypothetical protein
MKIRNLKLFTTLSVVALIVTGVCIFYACKKDEKENNSDKKLKKEAEFIAKNYEETCMQVEVFRDENGNAHFVSKMVANDPNEPISLMVSDRLNLAFQQTKEEGEFAIEIPNDAIYWLVPFDGYEPFKFAPIDNGTKNSVGGGSSGTVQIDCVCMQGYDLRDRDCKIETNKTTGKSVCVAKGNCTECNTICMVRTASGTTYFTGSTYLIKSNSITLNGITYE